MAKKSAALAVARNKRNVPAVVAAAAPAQKFNLKNMTMVKAVETFTDDELVHYNELAELVAQKNEKDLNWFWELGKKVASIYKAAQQAKGVYNAQLLERLSIALAGQSTPGLLYHTMHVVEVWPTKTAFREVANMRGEANNQLRWTHIVHLSSVNDKTRRDQLIINTLSKEWTTAQLYAEVKKINNSPHGHGGRKAKVPTSFGGFITHMSTQATKFVSLYDTAWTSGTFDLVKSVQNMPPEKLTDDVTASITTVEEQLGDLQDRINKAKALLKLARETADRRLAAKEGDASEHAAAVETDQPVKETAKARVTAPFAAEAQVEADMTAVFAEEAQVEADMMTGGESDAADSDEVELELADSDEVELELVDEPLVLPDEVDIAPMPPRRGRPGLVRA